MTLQEYLIVQARIESGRARLDPEPDALPLTATSERDLHDLILAECKRRQFYVIHSRMDKRTTQAVGVPDFVVFGPHGRVFVFEVKTRTGKLTPEQAGTVMWLAKLGTPVPIIRKFSEALALFDQRNPSQEEP